MSKTNYIPDVLLPLLKERKTTMPNLTGPQDPNRPAEGRPAEPFKRRLELLLQDKNGDLDLIALVSQKQAAEDRAAMFPEAYQYGERTGTVMNMRTDMFPGFPYTGNHLLSRMERTRTA